MNRSSDIIFMAEYIKNALYFATIRQGKTLKSTADTHYFCIDNELVYENYYSDFGPLNLGCVYKYCKLLNEKLKQFLNKQTIVHFTSIDPKKKANAAFLMGCYGVLYLSLHPRDALKPLLIHGQSYRPFQDATQGDSSFTISLLDCLQGITKARELGFFNFQDFNYEEYERLDKIQGGDLNWIVPGKFLAFIGPVDYSVSLYHPPEMYIDYFLENEVKIVIRLNKRLYDGNIFNEVGIVHYDLFFPDGSCPPRHILMKFLQISEESEGAIAVHCKAGLGRTGSLIGCYLMKHYRMTSHEAIAWMRICRPGSVIGHQQGWLEQLEAWLIKQGNLFRKRMFNNTDHLPYHSYGLYSISEKTLTQRPMFHKSPSPPPVVPRPELAAPAPARPQASKIYTNDGKTDNEDEEVFLTSCDLTEKPSVPMTQMKGCIIKNNTISEEYDDNRSLQQPETPLWKRIFCWKCSLRDKWWTLSVRCARVAPNTCRSNFICGCMDMVAPNKTEKEQHDRSVRTAKMNTQKIPNQSKGKDQNSSSSNVSRRGSGSGEPRAPRSQSRTSTSRSNASRTLTKLNESSTRNLSNTLQPTITTFRTTNGPAIKNVNDARNFLLRSSKYNEEREKHLQSSMTVTPHIYTQPRPLNYYNPIHLNLPQMTPSSYSSASKTTSQPTQRRRLGRSPSPPQVTRLSTEHTRATNTPAATPKDKKYTDKYLVNETSKVCLMEALSRLKLQTPRANSIGAASVGAASLEARRDAPPARRAPSVRSDERPLATQGDLLNSIKFQKRFRDTLINEKFHDKLGGSNHKERGNVKKVNSRTSTGTRLVVNTSYSLPKDNPSTTSRNFHSPTRPMSPKFRRTPNYPPNF